LQASTAAVLLAPAFRAVHAAPSRASAAESVVGELYESLSASQRSEVCRPFDDALRSKVHANWHVTKPLIGQDFYTDSQRAMIQKIVRNLTSTEGYDRIVKQMDDDDGGLTAYSMAIFGDPSSKQMEWVLTGRHLTLRADGNSLEKMAFGGGIVYGHGEETSPKENLFYYQTKKVNEVFAALDADQRQKALLAKIPEESKIQPRTNEEIPGLEVGAMKEDQRRVLVSALQTVLAPYRSEDSQEAMQLLEAAGGINKLRLAFYREGDLESDSVWDNWRIEGPRSVIHFRGAPHVHAYINIT
jgi:hypothetical protein